MPHDRGGAEGECPALLLETPADVDVVACRAEVRVPAADCLKRRSQKGTVAARDVLGLAIG